MGGRKVICGFKPSEAVGHSWATRAGVATILCKVAFSSLKAALVAKKEASCCWWDSC